MMTVVPSWRLADMLNVSALQENLNEVERQIVENLRPPVVALDALRPLPAPSTAEGDDDWLDPAEAARRRDETLRRMLNTPPKPQRKS
jgi:hypothetical protein